MRLITIKWAEIGNKWLKKFRQAFIHHTGIGGYKSIITNLLKVPAIRVWDEIMRIKDRLEKDARKITLNKVSRDKMIVKISSE